MYMNSLGMQAVVERSIAEAEKDPSAADQTLLYNSTSTIDYNFIQEVVESSCQILHKVISLAENGCLRYAPVRIFLRITTSSVFLVKGLSLGVWSAKLQNSLDLLEKAISALRSSTLDDMHLASRYATLLELHLARLRQLFVVSSRPPHLPSTLPSLDRTYLASAEAPVNKNGNGVTAAQPVPQGQNNGFDSSFAMQEDTADSGHSNMNIDSEDWLTLPFNPNMAPFGAGGMSAFPGLDDGTLDFIWNLPT